MTVGCGAAGQLAIAPESSYGTLATTFTTPSGGFPRGYEFISESLRLEHDVLQNSAFGAGDYYPFGTRRKLYRRDAGGGITLEVAPRGAALLFQHMLGSAAQTNLGGTPTAYKYTSTPSTLKGLSLSIQKGVPESDMTAIRPYTALGCKVAAWQLDASIGRPLLLSLAIDASDLKDPTNPSGATGPALASPTWPTPVNDPNTAPDESTGRMIPYSLAYDGDGPSSDAYTRAVLTVAGSTVAHLSALRLVADNALDLHPYRLDSSGLKREPLETGYRTLTGVLLAEFKSLDGLYNAFYGDSACSLVLQCDGRTISGANKESLKITLPDVRFIGETPVVDDPQLVTLSASFVACDKGDGSAPVTIEYVTADGAA